MRLKYFAAAVFAVGLLTSCGSETASATECGLPPDDVNVTVTTNDRPERKVAEGDTVDGDSGVTVTGQADGLPDQCTVWLLDHASDKYYMTTPPADGPDFRFANYPIGGDAASTRIGLTLVAATPACDAELRQRLEDPSNPGHPAYPAGCEELWRLTVTADRG